MTALEPVFVAFCSFGSPVAVNEMDGKGWNKFCKDAGMMSKTFTSTDSDLVFAKVKAKGQRKIGFTEFRKGLQEVSLRQGIAPDKLADLVMSARPTSTGTVSDAVKLHDDKTLYTGVYKNGGPTTVDPRPPDLADLLDRSEADVRGIKLSDKTPAAPKQKPAPKSVLPTVHHEPKVAAKPAAPPPAPSPPTGDGSLRDAFRAYCLFGGGRDAAAMDGSKFAKCLKDAGLVSKTFTSTSADLLFAKVKAKGEKKISFAEFRQALSLLAEQTKQGLEAVEAAVAGVGAPNSTGTVADAVKFHDDKTLYTGVYKNGGPTNVDRGAPDLASHVDRSEADVRGVKLR